LKNLDNKVTEYYKSIKSKIAELKRNIERLKNSKIICDVHNVREWRNELAELEIMLNSQAFYMLDAYPMVLEFINLRNIPTVINLGQKKVENVQLKSVITRYIQAVRSIGIPISLPELKPIRIKNICPNCQSKNAELVDDRIYICNSCGTEIQEIIAVQPIIRESDNMMRGTQYKYERSAHFYDCVKQFQAKQNCKIEDALYTDLEKLFKLNNLLVLVKDANGNMVPAPGKARFAKITLDHVNFFLRQKGWTKHYENDVLIWVTFTGQKAIDISHLESMLFEDFSVLENLYYKLPITDREDRTNFPNSQYILYQLLLKHNFKCSTDNFHILKTEDRLNWHNDIVGRMFKHLGWPFTTIRL